MISSTRFRRTGFVTFVALLLAAPSAPAASAPKSRDPAVLVVADETAGVPGASRPTPGHPIYYLFAGKKEKAIGSVSKGEPKADPAAVEKAVVKALASQGYVQTGLGGPPPQLAILIEWGSAHMDIDVATPPGLPAPKIAGGGDPMGIPKPDPEDNDTIITAFNHKEMMTLIGADKLNHAGGISDTEAAQLNDALTQRRVYVVIGAFDAMTLVREKKFKQLWRTTMSINAVENSLPDSLAVMLESGAPFFGKEVQLPALITEKNRNAEVIVGTPRVVPDQSPPAEKKAKR